MTSIHNAWKNFDQEEPASGSKVAAIECRIRLGLEKPIECEYGNDIDAYELLCAWAEWQYNRRPGANEIELDVEKTTHWLPWVELKPVVIKLKGEEYTSTTDDEDSYRHLCLSGSKQPSQIDFFRYLLAQRFEMSWHYSTPETQAA